MKKDSNDKPSSIDQAKRLFLKKLAVISACSATPATALLSLGAKPSAARAQEVTEPPLVVSAAFVAGGGGQNEPFGTLRVTFSKPMATSLNTCKSVTGMPCDEVVVESKIDVQSSIQSAGGKSPMVTSKLDLIDEIDLSSGWTWADSVTEEKQILTPVESVRMQLNAPGLGCTEGESYQSEDGDLLVPFEATLNTWEHCEGCEPVVLSKIDSLP